MSDNWMTAKHDDGLGEWVELKNVGPEVRHLREIPELYNSLRGRQLTPPAGQIMQAVKGTYPAIKEASRSGDRTTMVRLLQDLADTIEPINKQLQRGAPSGSGASEVNKLVGAVRSARDAL